MDHFNRYSSSTVASGANQSFFEMAIGEIRTGLALFKISQSGKYNYSLLFSDITDSTFAGGEKSRVGMSLGGYIIHSLKVGRCSYFPSGEENVKNAELEKYGIKDFKTLLFDGNGEKAVNGFVFSDPVSLCFQKGDYMAVEITYSGKRVPYHPESILPLYNKTDNGYVYSTEMPLPIMIGSDREVRGKICYLGDSITQGIGAGFNTYLNWCALLANKIGGNYAHYNIGIGYARASDAAYDGSWLLRAKQCDTVFLCLGTNDIGSGADENDIKASLKAIICKLKSSNCRIILQTLPPFCHTGEKGRVWNEVNRIIREELSLLACEVFDIAPLLALSPERPTETKYGGHPNAEGCKIWADALYEKTKNLFN